MVGTIGDVGCFSFCQSKHFTTGGEGGMVLTNDEHVGWEARSFRDHGYDVKKRMNMLALEEKLPTSHPRGFKLPHDRNAVQIGLNEMKRFDSWNMPARLQYAKMYDEAFAWVKRLAKLAGQHGGTADSYWWYPSR